MNKSKPKELPSQTPVQTFATRMCRSAMGRASPTSYGQTFVLRPLLLTACCPPRAANVESTPVDCRLVIRLRLRTTTKALEKYSMVPSSDIAFRVKIDRFPPRFLCLSWLVSKTCSSTLSLTIRSFVNETTLDQDTDEERVRRVRRRKAIRGSDF